MDTHSIMPAANARLADITLSSFFSFINIGMVPIIVDSPAIVVKRNAILVLFIYITNKLYEF